MAPTSPRLELLAHPYRDLTPARPDVDELRRRAGPGVALVWHPEVEPDEALVDVVRSRPGGMALLIVLPPADRLDAGAPFVRALERTRPCGVLPHHEGVSPADLAYVLRRPPTDLPTAVTEYLRWRGFTIEKESVHLVRRIVELSGELRSVSTLARALYLSRRALGRRLMTRGLPVPSHWLHVSRLLRVAIRLQNCDETVLSIGFGLGYPDAFSLSNQMMRLTGHRPTEARTHLGWEWLLEAWLRKEAEAGSLTPTSGRRSTGEAAPVMRRRASLPSPDGRRVG